MAGYFARLFYFPMSYKMLNTRIICNISRINVLTDIENFIIPF
jgi:hypothetical protein